MNHAIEFTILGRGQQRGSKQASLIPKRGGGFVTDKTGRPIIAVRDMNKKSKSWMQEVRAVAFAAFGPNPLINEPVVLTARFYFMRPSSHFGSGKNADKLKPSAPAVHAQSPDLAKLLRSLEDALTGVIWKDDKLVFQYGPGTGRFWSVSQERTEVMITTQGQE